MDYVQQLSCPGFCGRILLNETENGPVYSDCQACPWSTRRGENFLCTNCTSPLRAYDYAFLVFHTLLPLFISGLFINYYSGNKGKNGSKIPRLWLILQIFCAVLESSLSLISSMLIFKPHGSFLIYSCMKNTLHEWYPMFYNPVINYTKTMRCTQEIVYPLFSLPYTNLAINLLNLLVFRSFLYSCASLKFSTRLPSEPFYATLWTLPIIALIHSFLSGLIYYSFPYLTLLCSLSLNAIHLATEGRRTVLQLLKQVITKIDNIAVVVVHMLLLGFGFVSLILSPNRFNIANVVLIMSILPLPTIFYILTVRLTTPPRSQRYHR